MTRSAEFGWHADLELLPRPMSCGRGLAGQVLVTLARTSIWRTFAVAGTGSSLRPGPARFGFSVHNAWPPAWQEIGNEPGNEVLIIIGTGGQWLGTPETIAVDRAEGASKLTQGPLPRDFPYEHGCYDATKLQENFVFAVDIPTIAAINGPSAAHTEFALLCDVTLAAETATIIDPHLLAGAASATGSSSPSRSSSAPNASPTTSTPVSPSVPGRPSTSAWPTRCSPPTVSCRAPGKSPRPS